MQQLLCLSPACAISAPATTNESYRSVRFKYTPNGSSTQHIFFKNGFVLNRIVITGQIQDRRELLYNIIFTLHKQKCKLSVNWCQSWVKCTVACLTVSEQPIDFFFFGFFQILRFTQIGLLTIKVDQQYAGALFEETKLNWHIFFRPRSVCYWLIDSPSSKKRQSSAWINLKLDFGSKVYFQTLKHCGVSGEDRVTQVPIWTCPHKMKEDQEIRVALLWCVPTMHILASFFFAVACACWYYWITISMSASVPIWYSRAVLKFWCQVRREGGEKKMKHAISILDQARGVI